jgi:hypothetical protein
MPPVPSTPTVAALSRPMMALLLVSFFLNAGSGVALWLAAPQTETHQQWRVLHGWTIPLFLITLGVLWRVHVLRGWVLKKNVLSGVVTLVAFLLLTITGWSIYYPKSDFMQEWASKIHTWLGLAITFILLMHAIIGWRSR